MATFLHLISFSDNNSGGFFPLAEVAYCSRGYRCRTTCCITQAFGNPWLPFNRKILCLCAVKFQLHETKEMELQLLPWKSANLSTFFLRLIQNVCKGDHGTILEKHYRNAIILQMILQNFSSSNNCNF